ncbi:MAG TPA: alpha/beta fold hydrolase [Alphaproteobacteria bacterium]
MFEFFPGNYRWSYNTLLAFAAGGQLGDVALILPRLQQSAGDDDAWHREWSWLAEVLSRRAEGASPATASEDLFLSSLYHTIGEHFIPPADPRRLAAYGHVLATFERARALAPFPLERVLVPYDGTTLPAYFMPGGNDAARRPSLIFICGLDTTKELWFLRARQQFTQRGFNCLFVDTPGIGEALRYQKLYTRFDYERPVAAAIDYLAARREVDPERIGIVGSSLGGYYVSRAAAFEPRLKAAVAWGAIYDYHLVWVRRMAGSGIVAAPRFQLMFITGTETMEDAVKRIENFRLEPFAGRIACPFLIVHGAEDQQVLMPDAQAMFEAIGSADKELKVFSGEDGGAAHTQFDNHLPALHYTADWMQRKLG